MAIKTRKPGELVFNGILVLVSLFLVYQSYLISGFTSWSSPGFFPMLASTIMLLSALTTFCSAYRQPGRAFPVEAFISQLLPRNVVIMLVFSLLFVLCLNDVGFIISAFCFLFFSFWLFYRRGWLVSLGLSVTTLVVVYLVFRVIFLVVLPENDAVSTLLDPWLGGI